MQERILVVTAHPDDAEFFLGGTLATRAREGAAVRVVIAADGSWGSFAVPPEELVETRRAEAERAAAHYGGEVCFLDTRGYRDGSLASVPFDTLCGQVVWHVRDFRPTCVATFNPEVFDGHPDHDAIGRVALAAMQFAALPNAYPHQVGAGLEPHLVAARILFAKDDRRDNRMVDITPTIDVKVASILEHASQCVFLVSELVEQARSVSLDTSWFPENPTDPQMAAALIARAVRERARTVALKRPLGRLRSWLTDCCYAESFYYTPVPPVVADIAAQARLLGDLRRFLHRIHAEWLWRIVKRQVRSRLT